MSDDKLARALWQEAINQGLKCNETDSYNLAKAARLAIQAEEGGLEAENAELIRKNGKLKKGLVLSRKTRQHQESEIEGLKDDINDIQAENAELKALLSEARSIYKEDSDADIRWLTKVEALTPKQ